MMVFVPYIWKNRVFKQIFLRLLYLLIILLIRYEGIAQWSTSSLTDSSLFVCPGFLPGIVTFQDGSSVVLGALVNQIYARKLDLLGNFIWSDPVCVLNNDSSDITNTTGMSNWGDWITDDDGGVIIMWYDHRHAYYDTIYYDYNNNAIYVQKINKNGQIVWRTDGVLVKSPKTGSKHGKIMDDGVGGCVIAWDDNGFYYPDAPNIERFYVQRISKDGDKLWERVIDSNYTPYSLQSGNIVRLKDRFFIRYQDNFLCIDTTGTILYSDKSSGYDAIETADTTLYAETNLTIIRTSGDTTYYGSRLTRFTYNMDTIYTTIFEYEIIGEWMNNLAPIVPDGIGGVYPTWAYENRIYDPNFRRISAFRFNHFDGTSFWSDSGFSLDSIDVPYAASDGNGGLVALRYGTRVMRYNISGDKIWPNEVMMISDHQNIDFELFEGDHNGGVIMAFWTTSGGIHAQHSGRNGEVGIITGMNMDNDNKMTFFLYQNYPNPFNSSTTIKYIISLKTSVEISLYDIQGRYIRNLYSGIRNPGIYTLTISFENLSSGIYFYRLQTPHVYITKKMTLLK